MKRRVEVKVETRRPEPYRLAAQARGWLARSGLEQWARIELANEPDEVLVRKVNLLRGCWG